MVSLLITCGLTVALPATKVVNSVPFVPTCAAQYATIQAAVNAAAPNDIVYVCAAPTPYNEQVTISKPLTLAGQTGAVIMPGPMVANASSLISGQPIAAAVLVTSTTGVTIANITVDGGANGISGCAPNLVGIYYSNSSGTIANTAVRNFKLGAGLEGCQSGLGIFVQADDVGGISNVNIRSNSVHDFQKNGITGNEIGTTVTIASNTVTGLGPTPNIAQNGIQIGFGAGGAVNSNNVTNVVYSQCTDTATCTASSTGILLYQPTGAVNTNANNIGTTQTGIYYYDAGNGTISNNKVWNTLVWDGIAIYGDTTNVGGNNTLSNNVVTDNAESGIWISTDGNSVTNSVINETPIGIWFAAGASTQSANKFYNTPTTVQTGTPLVRPRGQLKVHPVR